MISSIIEYFFIKIQHNRSRKEMKQHSTYDLPNAKTKLKKKFRNNWNFFMASIKPFDYAIWLVLEKKTKKQMQLLKWILVSL